MKDRRNLQKECLLLKRKPLHLFHLCHFLLQALWDPLDQRVRGGLGLICQAECGDKQSVYIQSFAKNIAFNESLYEN